MVKIINDSVCRGVAGRRSGNVKGVVPHNTADNQTVQYHINRLRKYSNAQLERGFAHYFIDADTIGRTEDTFNGAWHVANYYGNMNYIGYEIVADRTTSRADLLQAEQNACWQMAQDLKYYKLPVNRETVKLHHEFSATECPKRSLIEHCGYDSTYAVPQHVTNKMKDYFIKEIKKYYDNPNLKPDGQGSGNAKPAPKPTPKPAVKPAPKPAPAFNINNYHTTKPFQIILKKADYAYKEKSLKNKVGKINPKGSVFTVVNLVYEGKYPRYELKSGLFITTRKDTVDIHKAAAKPAPKPAPKPVAKPKPVDNKGKWIAQKGKFYIGEATPDAVNVPVNQLPLTVNASGSGAKIADISKGNFIEYDAFMNDGKFIWIRQPRSGSYGYMATGNVKNGKRSDYWGRFK